MKTDQKPHTLRKTHWTLDGEQIERDIIVDEYDALFLLRNATNVRIDVTNDVPKFYDTLKQKTISLARAILENRRKMIPRKIVNKSGNPYDLRIDNLT